ncbi:MAG: hypothetical protein N3D15_05505 [Syntrophorhabdaceae bacterium]|nr:hypothetical protein [Syntrophorhabdaceae bacterium]
MIVYQFKGYYQSSSKLLEELPVPQSSKLEDELVDQSSSKLLERVPVLQSSSKLEVELEDQSSKIELELEENK